MKIKFMLFLFNVKKFFKKTWCDVTNSYHVDSNNDLIYLLKQGTKTAKRKIK